MPARRSERITSLITQLAAEYIERNSGRSSIITVTGCEVSDDLKTSTIYFTSLPESEEQRALDFLKRQRSDFRDFVKKNWRMHTIPFFDFEIDKGEKNRQRIDELLNQAKLSDQIKG